MVTRLIQDASLLNYKLIKWKMYVNINNYYIISSVRKEY